MVGYKKRFPQHSRFINADRRTPKIMMPPKFLAFKYSLIPNLHPRNMIEISKIFWNRIRSFFANCLWWNFFKNLIARGLLRVTWLYEFISTGKQRFGQSRFSISAISQQKIPETPFSELILQILAPLKSEPSRHFVKQHFPCQAQDFLSIQKQ